MDVAGSYAARLVSIREMDFLDGLIWKSNECSWRLQRPLTLAKAGGSDVVVPEASVAGEGGWF
jgi:hypothetical protein